MNRFNDSDKSPPSSALITEEAELKREKWNLVEALELAEGIINAIPDVLFEVDRQGRYLNIWTKNPELLAAPKEELLGRTIHEILPPEQAAAGMKGIAEADAKGVSYGHVIGIPQPDGGHCWFEHSMAKKPGSTPSADTFLVLSRDVTERKQMQLALAAREQEFRTLVENSPDMVARYNRGLQLVYVNPAFAAALAGGNAAALLGTRPSDYPYRLEVNVLEHNLQEAFETGAARDFELMWEDITRAERCSLVRLAPEFDEQGAVERILMVSLDITELSASRQKIHQMAFYDPLTSLPNRALFNDRLRQITAEASRHRQMAGVMLIGIDRFKAVNDTMGYAVGDELLREAAVRLGACVRSCDTVARLGGDEFAILLPDIRHGDDPARIAGKMLDMFGERFLLDEREIFVSCSIGIALYPHDSGDPDDLVRYADSAMYLAKRRGRNNFRYYSSDLTANAREYLTLESELRRAAERMELELHYQPKVSLSDGMIVGSEALLRWHHPRLGTVPPTQFIQIAEETGLIIDLGQWVLYEACRTAAAWNTEGKPSHKMAINLSARQFESGELATTVAGILDDTACRPEWIELEITESLLLDDNGRTLEALSELRSMGVSIAIDDFGTGYSALSYLARFPIDTLKIDRVFIQSATTDRYGAELVKAILSIARSLGQEVVAEGVETVEQSTFLAAHGCQLAQGFLYSKAVPGAEFVSLTRNFSVGQSAAEMAGPERFPGHRTNP